MPIRKYLHFILWLTSLKSRVDGNMNCSLTTYSANWTVGGVCDGTFPPFKECQNNPHLCRWNESFSYKGNVIRTFSGQYSAESVANYVNCRVTCSFKAALPASEGKYSYTVEIDNITSNISLEILSPEQPSVSSCPMFAPKSNESRVTCNCTTPKYGHPSGILTWPGYSNTSQITVSRSDQDSVFTCQLTWGAQNWTVVYNPRLYPPAHLPMISGYKSGQLLLTGSTLTLTCRVTGGHPLVSSIEFKCGSYIASQSAKFKDSVISTFILDELNGSHDGILCSCNATWPPDPQSYPYVTSVTLKVVDIGLFLGTIIGSASFVVIAVIIITIIVVKRRTTKAIKALQDVTSQGSTSAPEQNVQLTGVYTEITDVDYRPSDREINISQPKCSSEANACTHIVKIPKRANTVVRAKAASNDGMCHSQEARRKSEANSDIYNILSHTQKESSSKQLDPLYNHCKEATSKQPDPLYNNCNEATSKQPDPLYNHCNEATSRQPDPLYNHCNEATSKQLDPLYNHCNEATSRQPDPLYNHCNEATSRQPDPLYNHCNEATSRQPDPLYNHCNEATSKQPDPLYNHCNEATSRQPDPLYNHCNEATSKQLDPLYNHCNEATSRQPDLLYNHCNEATSRQPDPLYNHCNEATSKQPDPLYNHCNEATSRQPDPLYNHCIEATSRQPDPLYNHCNEAFSSQTDLLFNNCIESVIKTT